MSDFEIILRLVLAAGVVAIVGSEREFHGRPAGLRTHILVALGAAIMSVDSCMVSGTQLDTMARLGPSSSAMTAVHNRETSLSRAIEGPSVMSLPSQSTNVCVIPSLEGTRRT